MKVLDIMTKNPVKVEIMTSVKDVAKLMRDKSVSSVIIVKNERPIGIVTERDLVRRVIASGKDPDHITAFDICSKPVIAVPAISEIDDAIDLMKKNRIRRVVVVDSNDRAVGVLTTDDLGYNLKSLSEDLAIKYVTIMKRQTTE